MTIQRGLEVFGDAVSIPSSLAGDLLMINSRMGL